VEFLLEPKVSSWRTAWCGLEWEVAVGSCWWARTIISEHCLASLLVLNAKPSKHLRRLRVTAYGYFSMC